MHNPDFEEPSPSNEKDAEQFNFNRFPWSELPQDRCGVSVLKDFLGKLLCRQIRSAFPGMQDTISEMLVSEEDKLQRLGEPRNDRQQRLQYIMHVVREYNSLAHHALSSPASLPLPSMKLRGQERKAAEAFKENIETKGSFYQFLSARDTGTATHDHHLYRDIKTQIVENRGEELPGLFNPTIVRPLFKKQICHWEQLGKEHLTDVVSMTFTVAMTILEYVFEGNNVPVQTRNELKAIVSNFRAEAGRRAIEKLTKFCYDASTNPLYTDNDAFHISVKESRKRRFVDALVVYHKQFPPGACLRELGDDRDANHLSNSIIVNAGNPNYVDSLFQLIHPSEEQNMANEIHDLLSSYYKVSKPQSLRHSFHYCPSLWGSGL